MKYLLFIFKRNSSHISKSYVKCYCNFLNVFQKKTSIIKLLKRIVKREFVLCDIFKYICLQKIVQSAGQIA